MVVVAVACKLITRCEEVTEMAQGFMQAIANFLPQPIHLSRVTTDSSQYKFANFGIFSRERFKQNQV